MSDLKFPDDFSESDYAYWDNETTDLLNKSHRHGITQWTNEETGESLVTLTHNDLIRLVRETAEAYTGY